MPLIDKAQFRRGKDVEAWLDTFFRARGWMIEQTTPHEERVLCLGDRRFSRGGQTFTVEIKSGIQTYYSGNIFLETISVDSQNKPGWLFTCKADVIMYAALLNYKILVFKPQQLRDKIAMLRSRFREVATSHHQNDGYNTWGLLVPLAVAEKELAVQVITL